jgi:hypothetical protein
MNGKYLPIDSCPAVVVVRVFPDAHFPFSLLWL